MSHPPANNLKQTGLCGACGAVQPCAVFKATALHTLQRTMQPDLALEQRPGPESSGKSDVLNPLLLQAFRGLLLNCTIDP